MALLSSGLFVQPWDIGPGTRDQSTRDPGGYSNPMLKTAMMTMKRRPSPSREGWDGQNAEEEKLIRNGWERGKRA